eukprot:6186401-Pleurochrysis_carterae.AAC.1
MQQNAESGSVLCHNGLSSQVQAAAERTGMPQSSRLRACHRSETVRCVFPHQIPFPNTLWRANYLPLWIISDVRAGLNHVLRARFPSTRPLRPKLVPTATLFKPALCHVSAPISSSLTQSSVSVHEIGVSGGTPLVHATSRCVPRSALGCLLVRPPCARRHGACERAEQQNG